MVAAAVLVVALSLALQVVDGLTFPTSLIVALLIVNVGLSLSMRKRTSSSEDTTP